ncbi:MAG: HAD family hydrolase [Eubacterium sp.]|nr:HAD family hydrolase [Eubacterium sp.]
MNYKLICLDIDGTVLTDGKKVMPEVKQAVREASDMGIQIALASGRMPAGVDLVEKELGVQCVKICNAGTYVVLGDQRISARYLLPHTMLTVYQEIADKNQVPLWIFQERKWFVSSMDRYIEREMEIVQYRPEMVDINKLADQWEKEKTGPNKLLIAAAPEKVQAIYGQMKQQALPEIDLACSSESLIEIFPKGVSKGTALIRICEKLNISLEETIAIGDQELDLPMIEAAGVGIAMGNAIEELKQKASYITKTNNEAGVAHAIWHYLK